MSIVYQEKAEGKDGFWKCVEMLEIDEGIGYNIQ